MVGGVSVSRGCSQKPKEWIQLICQNQEYFHERALTAGFERVENGIKHGVFARPHDPACPFVAASSPSIIPPIVSKNPPPRPFATFAPPRFNLPSGCDFQSQAVSAASRSNPLSSSNQKSKINNRHSSFSPSSLARAF
jgi:hypothetical protein